MQTQSSVLDNPSARESVYLYRREQRERWRTGAPRLKPGPKPGTKYKTRVRPEPVVKAGQATAVAPEAPQPGRQYIPAPAWAVGAKPGRWYITDDGWLRKE